MAKLNPYTVSWLILIPEKGLATKKDVKKASKLVSGYTYFFSISHNKQAFFTHQPSKQAALSKISLLKGKLGKKYIAYIITDKQMELATKNNPDIVLFMDGQGVKFTSLQKKECLPI